MYAVLTCLQQHDPRLVAWAAAVCVVAVLTSLAAYRRAVRGYGTHRRLWVGITALLLGAGVWSTHFLAMLAFQPALTLNFGLGLTLASLVVAIAGLALGLGIAARATSAPRRAVGGAVCGGAVGLMHFTGVAAMRLPADMSWDLQLVTAALVIGVAGGALALTAAADVRTWRSGITAAVLLVLCICGLHFTAMGAVTLTPSLARAGEATIYQREALAVGVEAMVALITLAGLGLLLLERFSAITAFSSLKAALDSAASALAFFDGDDRLIFWNAGYVAILRSYGLTPAVGLKLPVIMAHAAAMGLPAATIDDAKRGMAPGEQRSLSPFVAVDGRWLQVQMNNTPNGGRMVVFTDITDQRALLAREAASRQEADEANRAKSEFLANMSHEIRTPLNAVLGMAQVMARDPLSPEQRERLDVIGEAGRALLAMLNGVLDLSKIEAGKLDLEVATFDLEQVVRASTTAFAGMAEEKSVDFRVSIADDARGVWRGDPGKLGQVLGNLASNALKFTSRGEVRVDCAIDDGGLRFAVSDTGLGIPDDKLAAIFEKFTQAEASTTRRFGGTGLGLAICRELVQLMGGRLEVTSRMGEGSCFAFTLPLERGHGSLEAAPADDAGAAHGLLRILAAEDNLTNQMILKALLEPLGAELTVVGDGGAAVAAFATGHFDVILMDAQMPVLSGEEAAVKIRGFERSRGMHRTPIIALTANVMGHQIEAHRAAGMDSFVAKPIDARALIGAIVAATTSGGDTAAA